MLVILKMDRFFDNIIASRVEVLNCLSPSREGVFAKLSKFQIGGYLLDFSARCYYSCVSATLCVTCTAAADVTN